MTDLLDRLAICGSTQFANRAALGTCAALIGAVLDTQRPGLVLVEAIQQVPKTGVAAVAEQAALARGIPVEYANALHRRWDGWGGYQWAKHLLVRRASRLLDMRCREDLRWTAKYAAEQADKQLGRQNVEKVWGM